VFQGPPGFRDIEDHPVKIGFLYPFVDVPYFHDVVLSFPKVLTYVFYGPLGKLLSYLIRDHLSFPSNGPKKAKRQGPGTYACLKDLCPGVDVCIKEDDPYVLRVYYLGVPFHMHDELPQGGFEGYKGAAGRGPYHRPVFLSKDGLEVNKPFVEVDLCPPFELISELGVFVRVVKDNRFTLLEDLSAVHPVERLPQPKGGVKRCWKPLPSS